MRMSEAPASAVGSTSAHTSPPDQSYMARHSMNRVIPATTLGPADGVVEMRQSGEALACKTESWRSSPHSAVEL